MQVFDAAATAQALPYGRLIAALEDGFRAGAEAPLRQAHDRGDGASLLAMPAWNRRVAGVKLVTVTPANAECGLPAVHGAYVLFDQATGRPLATVDGTELTLRRTAAASALAARYLAAPDARHLALFGAGALAPHLVRAHAVVRPIRAVTVWNRTAARAEALAAALSAEGFEATATTDRAAACRSADIISCATLATAPLVEGAWLRPGSHVDLVGAFLPTMRESDDAVLAKARVFVDTRAGALAEAGDLLQPIAAGTFTPDRIAGELADLCKGAVRGRGSAQEITAFKSVGTALEDLVAAALVVTGR
ncbi:MAG: ornithine cyclodeaminase family protein [Geminicoccaceae bacterium]|nr:MAG: ornithine cyclodeaminase family protein [Geminicoccaceae bacterium]